MRYAAAAIVRGASVHNRRKCVLTGYGRKKLAAMLESNRCCAKNVLCANVVRLFIPTDACCWCARTICWQHCQKVVRAVASHAPTAAERRLRRAVSKEGQGTTEEEA